MGIQIVVQLILLVSGSVIGSNGISNQVDQRHAPVSFQLAATTPGLCTRDGVSKDLRWTDFKDQESFAAEGRGSSMSEARRNLDGDTRMKAANATKRIQTLGLFDVQDGKIRNAEIGQLAISNIECNGEDRDYQCLADGVVHYSWQEMAHYSVPICR